MANGNGTNKLIIDVALLVGGYFLVLKPLLQKIGIQPSTNDLSNTAAGKSVGWNPTFYQTFLRTHNNNYQGHTQAFIEIQAKQIYNAWGLVTDDNNAIYAAIRQCRSLLELSQLSEKYAQLYGQDLYGRLTAPWSNLHDGLNADEMAVVSGIVNALPVAIKLN